MWSAVATAFASTAGGRNVTGHSSGREPSSGYMLEQVVIRGDFEREIATP
jgi:hypothetical protein